ALVAVSSVRLLEANRPSAACAGGSAAPAITAARATTPCVNPELIVLPPGSSLLRPVPPVRHATMRPSRSNRPGVTLRRVRSPLRGDSGVVLHADQAGQVQGARRNRLPGPEPGFDDFPDRLSLRT